MLTDNYVKNMKEAIKALGAVLNVLNKMVRLRNENDERITALNAELRSLSKEQANLDKDIKKLSAFYNFDEYVDFDSGVTCGYEIKEDAPD